MPGLFLVVDRGNVNCESCDFPCAATVFVENAVVPWLGWNRGGRPIFGDLGFGLVTLERLGSIPTLERGNDQEMLFDNDLIFNILFSSSFGP